jgi:formylglycine-generating enzyme required for sulfatase activity
MDDGSRSYAPLSEEWETAARSQAGQSAQCRTNPETGQVEIRNSKNPGPVASFTPAEWAAFTGSIIDGQFRLA